MVKNSYVYILTNERNGTLYVGVTSNIEGSISLHLAGIGSKFTKKYNTTMLVHIEEFSDIRDAIAREKAMKKWNRRWKLRLIEETNPDWTDLAGPPPTRG